MSRRRGSASQPGSRGNCGKRVRHQCMLASAARSLPACLLPQHAQRCSAAAAQRRSNSSSSVHARACARRPQRGARTAQLMSSGVNNGRGARQRRGGAHTHRQRRGCVAARRERRARVACVCACAGERMHNASASGAHRARPGRCRQQRRPARRSRSPSCRARPPPGTARAQRASAEPNNARAPCPRGLRQVQARRAAPRARTSTAANRPPMAAKVME